MVLVAILVWVEFYALISKIFSKKNFKVRLLKFLFKAFSLIYLFLLVCLIFFTTLKNPELQIITIYSILVSIMSDVGGLIIG